MINFFFFPLFQMSTNVRPILMNAVILQIAQILREVTNVSVTQVSLVMEQTVKVNITRNVLFYFKKHSSCVTKFYLQLEFWKYTVRARKFGINSSHAGCKKTVFM